MTCGPYPSREAGISSTRELVLVAQQHKNRILRTLFSSISQKNQIIVLNHLPYSLDLATLNFFLFLKVKLERKWTFFQDVNTIQAMVMRHLKAIPIESTCITILRTISHVVRIMLKPSIVFLDKFYIWCPYEFLVWNLLDILCTLGRLSTAFPIVILGQIITIFPIWAFFQFMYERRFKSNT